MKCASISMGTSSGVPFLIRNDMNSPSYLFYAIGNALDVYITSKFTLGWVACFISMILFF